jgi:hypothetical protein
MSTEIVGEGGRVLYRDCLRGGGRVLYRDCLRVSKSLAKPAPTNYAFIGRGRFS